MFLPVRQPRQTVFNDDHRAVDDQAEVERAEAHQVTGNMERVHAHRHHQEGEGNDEHRDDRGAPVAEQEEERGRHEQRALGEVLLDGSDRCVHKLGAIEHHLDLDARREGLRNLGDLRRDILGHGAAVLTDQHEHGADHRLLAVHAARTGAKVAADPHIGELTHSHGNPAARRDDGVADFVDRADACIDAHEIGLAGPVVIVGADCEIGAFEGFTEFAVGNAVAGEAGRVGLDDEGLGIAADRVDAGNAADRFQLRAHDPVLDRAQIAGLGNLIGEHIAFGGQIAAVGLPAGLPGDLLGPFAVGVLVTDGVHDDLAETCRHRPDLRLHPVRQIFARLEQAFAHLLACEIEIGVVGEDRRHLAEAVARDRACRLEPRNACQRDFDRIGNQLLDFDRRQTRVDRVDLDLFVGDIGDRVDRKLGELPDAEARDGEEEEEHRPALPDG